METTFFIIFSVLAVGGALSTVLRKNPLHCAMSLIVTFVALAGLYLMNAAPFAGVLQIMVYAGAIMVLVVFVIMFLNLPEAQLEDERIHKPGLILALFLVSPLVALTVGMVAGDHPPARATIDAEFGSVEAVGGLMFDKYLFHFEAISVLLLVAIVGAVMLAKKRI